MQAEAMRLGAQAMAVAFSSRPATVRKHSTFCPARAPKAIRYVHEAGCKGLSGLSAPMSAR